MISIRHARKLRAIIEDRATTLTDEQALDVPEMFPKWTARAYEIGDRVRYEGKLYKCVQAHPTNDTYVPSDAVSLWAEVLNDTIREWVQPDSTNPYQVGDKVIHNGHVWICTIPNCVWEPGVAGWEVVE